MMKNIYISGQYLKNNPTWHSEHAPRKARDILRLIEKHRFKFSNICDVGCGSGEILRQLKQNLPKNIDFFGFEVSPQAHKLCLANSFGINYIYKDFLKTKKKFDLILIIDVVEHIDAAIDFLSNIRKRGKHYIFQLPLDLNLQNAAIGRNIIKARHQVGHIHYYTRELAFEILNENGFKVIDYFITPAFSLCKPKTMKNRVGHLLRKILFALNSDLAAKLMNGFSIMIYCR